MESSSDLSKDHKIRSNSKHQMAREKPTERETSQKQKSSGTPFTPRSCMKTILKEWQSGWSTRSQCMQVIEPELSPLSVRRCQSSMTTPTRTSTRERAQIETETKGPVQVIAMILTPVRNILIKLVSMETLMSWQATSQRRNARDRWKMPA
ncbi:hypothetical protein OXYTRIMIC_442 [Oxytricha trifallax]|uniref:Uncharacterized protein n=1 Tax=Oxytricha trifallax TaxID=1172189 RepID=A0A073I0W4_9SPIT|nr:hypothetical protein OXYTRIMIC_442 [Oxytricha trifallax]